MIKDITQIKIGPVWNSGRGASYREEIEAAPDFGPEIVLETPLQAELLLIRMKNGITAVLKNLSSDVNLTCARCLNRFTFPLNIEAAEAHFYENPPQRDYDPLEVYFIRTQNMSIDLTDALRQEIILHFPLIAVCSESCKGLCPSCTVNLNQHGHKKGCTEPDSVPVEDTPEDTHRPFSQLKDLMKQ
jgi:uncharacterized metal-binding protein YceD (DUF177 family)